MTFDDTYVITAKRETSSLDQVADAERQLGVQFPTGYAEFVTELGTGLYCNYVRVYAPDRILSELNAFRERVGTFYFWDEGENLLPPERVVGCVVVADTVVGDEIVFHPDDPGQLFVLPRELDEVFAVGADLESALTWLCGSGKLTAPIGFRWFESLVDRQHVRLSGPGTLGEISAALFALGVHDHLQDDTGDADPFATFFVPTLHGTVSLHVIEPGSVDALIWHDTDADPAAVQLVVERLNALGLAPLATGER